jgi:branched-chain amino acid transport system substrate-binding protein
MTRIDASRTSDPIRIGVLYSRSGVTSAAEFTQLQATMLAVEEINRAGGVSGREIELVCLDPQCQPRRYADLAEQLILEHRVRVIVGC